MATTAPHPPSVIPSSDDWSELQALKVIEDNLNTFMGKLTPAQQQEYLRQCKEHTGHEATLSQAINNFYTDLNKQMLEALEAALTLKTGKAINSRTTYLKTRVRQLPIPASELPDIDDSDVLSRRVQVFKEDLSVREYERSMTLLEAAQRNFGFTAYFSTEEQNASYISDNTLSVFDFVAVARQVDLGQQVTDFIEQHFATRLSTPLFSLHATKLSLALYDACRTTEPWGIDAQAFNNLNSRLSDKTLQWTTYQIDAGGEKITLPFFTRRFETSQGTQVYSYFPDRPNGAFRRHFSVADAVEGLQLQLRNDVGLETFNWFIKALSLNNQEKLRTFIKPVTVNRDKLYWHARLLYDLFASKTPNREKLLIEPYGVAPHSLTHALAISLSWPVQSDLVRLARNTRLADREAAVALLKYLVSETLSMLLIPVPGGVTGLSRVMLVATLGTLAVQTIEAVSALRQGRQAELIQAVSDIFDLMVSARLQGVGARLSQRRTRQLMHKLGSPKAGMQSAGGPGLWFMQAYTQVDPKTLDGLEANEHGLFERAGQHFIKISVDGQDKVARVTRDSVSGRYRLTHHAAAFEPFVTYHAQHKRWTLDPIDTQPLTDHQLLQRIMDPTEQPLSLDGCRRALDVAGIDRRQLLAIWAGHETPRWTFTQAIEEQYLREQIRLLRSELQQPAARLPAIAEQLLPALLADVSRCSVTVYQPDGTRLVTRHSPVLATNERAAPAIELLQTGDGRYRTRALASAPDTLLHVALQEYERLNPNGTLGKTGMNAQDQHLANRLLETRKTLGQHLGRHLDEVFHALWRDLPRAQLAANNGARRFAPTDKPAELSVSSTLRRRFPALFRSAADELARLHPTLAIGDYSPIDAPARAAIQAQLGESRVVQALGALSDPAGIGLDQHSEALFCHLLPLLPNWPTNLAIQVYQASYDHAGYMIGRSALLDTYGPPGADTFVMLIKGEHKYAGYLQDSGDVHLPPRAENSLISATLRTLTDTQRNSLGRGIYDRDGLVADVMQQARMHRAYLPGLLPPTRLLPLSSQTLAGWGAFDMRQVSSRPDAEGVYAIAGRKYVNIDQTAYQVMLDRDAQTAEGNVWRIVNPKDPVAADAENIYHASRSGETRAVTRNTANLWVRTLVGALGGMRRTAQRHDTKAFLMQRFEPIRAAFNGLVSSGTRFDELLALAQKHPEGSDAETAALVALEVHTIRHTRLQESYVNSLIEHKDWLVLLKTGGLYKEELVQQQTIRVDFLNKLMGIMDLRGRQVAEQDITVETCKKILAHMNKKLEILQKRKEVVEQIRKLSRSDAEEMDRINAGLPDANKVQVTRFNVLNRLLTDNPKAPPIIGVDTAMAIHWVTEDLPNIPERSQPVALRLALEQIAVEKPDYVALLGQVSPERVTSVNGILAIIDTYETQLENRITQLHEKLASNQELPAYDQDIDFDFVPAQPAEAIAPAPTRKMFRTRRNGSYKVMVGIKETAPDGSVTVKVDDPFKLDLARRYEKRAGEWQLIEGAISPPAKPLLAGQADALLAKVDDHMVLARANEGKKHYPTNIYEFLSNKANQLSELAQKLEGAGADVDSDRIARLKAGSNRLMTEGRDLLIRMYKNKDVLNVQRLDYLLDNAQLSVVKTLNRKPLGKGNERSYLDVYGINDAADNTPLWEAHFHYDRLDRPALDYMIKGGHLKTLAQSRQGSGFQQREEQAGRAHQAIWREAISLKVAQKLFERAQ